jgi:peptidylprolyl isomerase
MPSTARVGLALLTCLALHAQATDGDIVARMGEIGLTLAETRQLAEALPAETRTKTALDQLVRTELIRRAVAAEARRQGFDRKPEVAARMQQAAQQALVTAYLNDLARPPADFPPDNLLREAHEANKAAFTTDRQYRVSQIYIAGTDDKARRQAEEVHRQATRKRADFAEIARKSSQHPASAAQGGDMGWLAEKDMLPSIRAALASLKPDEVSPPVAGGEGFHILRLAERKEPEVLPLSRVKDTLTRGLRLRKAQEMEAAYLDGLLARTPVAVNEIALGGLLDRQK